MRPPTHCPPSPPAISVDSICPPSLKESRERTDANVVALERDPTARAPGQYTRSIVQRLRMRTLLMLGGLAVATTLMGRRFGWQDPRFLGAEVALLAVIILHLPLRAAAGRPPRPRGEGGEGRGEAARRTERAGVARGARREHGPGQMWITS